MTTIDDVATAASFVSTKRDGSKRENRGAEVLKIPPDFGKCLNKKKSGESTHLMHATPQNHVGKPWATGEVKPGVRVKAGDVQVVVGVSDDNEGANASAAKGVLGSSHVVACGPVAAATNGECGSSSGTGNYKLYKTEIIDTPRVGTILKLLACKPHVRFSPLFTSEQSLEVVARNIHYAGEDPDDLGRYGDVLGDECKLVRMRVIGNGRRRLYDCIDLDSGYQFTVDVIAKNKANGVHARFCGGSPQGMVHLMGVLEQGNATYLLMERVDYFLDELCAETNNCISVCAIRDLMKSLLSALALLHAQGLGIRIKGPDSIAICRGKPKFADFECIYNIGETACKADKNSNVFQAPELGNGATLQPWSDVYSCGVLLYYLVEAEYPNPNGAEFACRTWSRHSAMRQLCEALLQPDPRNRPDAKKALECVWLHNGTNVRFRR